MNEKKEVFEELKSGLTARSLITGLVLAIFWSVIGAIAVNRAFVVAAGFGDAMSMTLVTLFILLLVSSVLRERGYTEGELVVVNVMMMCGGGGTYILTVLASIMSSAAEQFFQLLPPVLFPKDWNVITPMLTGGAAVPWGAWAVPLIFWNLQWGSLMLFNTCFALILSERILKDERLPYPWTSALINFIREPKKPIRERIGLKLILIATVIGFVIESTFDLIYRLLPAIPFLWGHIAEWTVFGLDLGPILGPNLTNNMALLLAVNDWPLYIPLFFLIPTKVTGTAILTFIALFDILPLIEVKLGWVPNIAQYGLYGLLPQVVTFLGNIFTPQAIQVLPLTSVSIPLGVAIVYLAFTGKTLGRSFMSAVRGGKTGGLPNRLLWIGFIGGFLVFIGTMLWSQIPLQATIPIAVLGLLLVHACTRVRGETTIAPSIHCHNTLRDLSFNWAGGGQTTASISSIFAGWGLGGGVNFSGGSMTPYYLLESLRLADMTKTQWKGVVIAGMISTVVVGVIGFLMLNIWGPYTYGYQVGWNPKGFTDTVGVVEGEILPVIQGQSKWGVVPLKILDIIIGIIIAAIITFLSFRFLWFPLNPIGLILGGNGVFAYMQWFMAIIGFVARVLVLRIGGSKLYEEKGVPFALGMMLGAGICGLVDNFIVLATI